MDISTIIKAVSVSQELRAPGDAWKDLTPGDRLNAKVIRVESEGRVLVDLGRSKLLAQISFPVNPGQLLDLQVVETGRVLHLRALSGEDHTLAAPMPREDFSQVFTKDQLDQFCRLLERLIDSGADSRPSGGVPADILNAASQVRMLFEPVALEQPVDQIAQWIKAAVEDRGILFEKKLADLVSEATPESGRDPSVEGRSPRPARVLITRDIKPQLMILRDFLVGSGGQSQTALQWPSQEADSLRHGLERLVEHVTRQQERAVSRWQAGETQQVLVHLWPLEQQKAPVELKVYYPKRRDGDKGGRHHHIALLLNMDRLGAVRVDLTLVAGQLHISFFVGSEELKARIQTDIRSVKEALAGTFAQLQVDVYQSREKIAQFHEEDKKGAAAGRIDINA